EVAFDLEPRGVAGDPELLLPCAGIGGQSLTQPLKFCSLEPGVFAGAEKFLRVGPQFKISARLSGGVGERAEPIQVTGPAGLRARPHGRLFPSSEGLPANNGAGDSAVDVEVARVDRIEPQTDLV